MEESEVKKQWHGPFCSAVRLELAENKKELKFENEYSLSTKPLQIDLLVIRLTGKVPLKTGRKENGWNLLHNRGNIISHAGTGDKRTG